MTDLDPAAVQAATFALAMPGSLPDWLSIPALGRNMTPIAEIAVAAAAPFIARATADAIADKIEAAEPGYSNGPEFHAGMHAGAYIARSHGSQSLAVQ